MAVVIRMRRTGRKNRPCFRINVTDSRFPRDGRHLETLGLYDPIRKDPQGQVVVDLERVRFWLEHGATMSETVTSILKRQGFRADKPFVKRERPGRKKKTATRARRDKADADRAAAKKARSSERVAARRQAKKAAAAATAPA